MYKKNNYVILKGVVLEEARYSHRTAHETFYLIKLGVARFSGKVDEIPVLIADNTYDVFSIKTGQWLSINGRYHSYNKLDGDGTHLILSVYGYKIKKNDAQEYENRVYLNGYVCRKPIWRKTPLEREITDVLVAVNRLFGKSDYIPCICWRGNARSAAGFSVGTRINIVGRIQSREYLKRYNDGKTEQKTAYEVSVQEILDVEMVRVSEKIYI